MRKIYRTLLCGSLLLFSLGFSSCEDYLDKEADSTVSEDEAFKNFRNFQGFIEEIYNCIPDKEKNNYTTSWNWGDDEIFNPEGDSHMTHQVDLGNFRAWSTNNQCNYGLLNHPFQPPKPDRLFPHPRCQPDNK